VHQASAYAAITQSGSSADVVFAAAAISHANVSIARSSAWACFELRRRSLYGAQRLTKRFQRFEQHGTVCLRRCSG
jgi:hypothetical protein